jgi:diguanylate cyclase (GGDEF)-like protein
MFESTTALPKSVPPAGQGETPAIQRPFPPEYEAEFAELQERASSSKFPLTVLVAGLLFHAILIVERHSLGIHPGAFILRGAPLTLGLLSLLSLLSLLFLPPSTALARYTRVSLCLVGWGAVVALLGGVGIRDAGTLFSLQTAVAALILLLGWTPRLPIAWTAALSGGMLAANVLCVALGMHHLGAAALQSIFAPAFATGFCLLTGWVRQAEARRDFMGLRTAAFAGVEPGAGAEEGRHLDPITGVGSREAFDMRLRAAWEQALTRRNSVALMLFSMDDFTQKRRTHGQRVCDQLQTKIAGLLKESLRRSDDMVARYDMHHFVVMLPGVGTDGATQIAERLRGCIEEMSVYVDGQRYQATVTVGVASLRAKRVTPREKLIDCTVAALEQGKNSGQNLVCVEGRGCLPSMA